MSGPQPVMRSCRGCRKRQARAGLLRLRPDDQVGLRLAGWDARDLEVKGRGLYACPSAECLQRMLRPILRDRLLTMQRAGALLDEARRLGRSRLDARREGLRRRLAGGTLCGTTSLEDDPRSREWTALIARIDESLVETR